MKTRSLDFPPVRKKGRFRQKFYAIGFALSFIISFYVLWLIVLISR